MALASAAAAGSAFSMMAAPQGSQSRIVTRASGPSPASAPSSGGVAGVTGLVGAGLVASAALSRSVKPRGGKNLVSMAARGGESYDALVKDLETLVKEKECGPILVRLSWHDAGVFSDGKLKGGCPNAAMRFTDAGEGTFGANAGLPDVALGLLKPITEKYVPDTIGHADLWTLAANVAIKVMGGPDIKTRFGRK
ncbi:APX1, partial [Symbiodinium necroappetens]